MEAKSRLDPVQYWTRLKEIRKTSKQQRTKERSRLGNKVEFLAEKARSCTNHILCKWIRNHMDKNRESQEGEKKEYGPKTIIEVVKEECEKMEEIMEEMSRLVKETEKKVLTERMVKTFGGVELDEEEKSFLALGPEFAMYEELKEAKAESDFLMAATKIRWDRMGKDPGEVTHMTEKKEIEQDEEIEKEIFMSRRVFNEDESKIEMGYQVCTSMKTNRRVVFPPGRPNKEETNLEERSAVNRVMT